MKISLLKLYGQPLRPLTNDVLSLKLQGDRTMHQEEEIRWLQLENKKGAWQRKPMERLWIYQDTPDWNFDGIIIVDDCDATERMLALCDKESHLFKQDYRNIVELDDLGHD